MSRPFIQIGDDVREMTPDEHEKWKSAGADAAALAAAADAKAGALVSARAKLAALGLTADEIAALLDV